MRCRTFVRPLAISALLGVAAMIATALGDTGSDAKRAAKGDPRGEAKRPGSSVNEAARFYHQGRYDSALARLQAVSAQGPFKRRDSLSLYQYLGMASARLGRDSQAVAYFATLLAMDSLFQFPKNEDSLVLHAFADARVGKTADPRKAADGPSLGTATLPPSLDPSAPSMTTALSGPTGTPAAQAEPARIPSLAPGWTPEKAPLPARGKIGFALGAVPLGAGWLARNKVKPGVALGILQAGGICLSLYASHLQTQEANDAFKVRDQGELDGIRNWQWVQRISLSTAVGAYIFSLIAAAGD
jgi:hypothetical protein